MDMLKKLFSLEGKVVVITGAAQGIGKTVAGYIAAVGADLVLFDKQKEKVKGVADSIAKEYGCRTFSMELDVTKPDDVKAAIHEAAEIMGGLDCLFNNAGIVHQKPIETISSEEWLNVINVNLNGVFFVAQAFGAYLINNKRKGSIVNTASMSGTIVNFPQQQASYNTSKAGVMQLTKSLAVEWAEKGIRVNSISPGYIFTELTAIVRQDWQDIWVDLTPYKRMGKPEELAGAVIYLLSDSASFTSGSDLIIDGCFTSV